MGNKKSAKAWRRNCLLKYWFLSSWCDDVLCEKFSLQTLKAKRMTRAFPLYWRKSISYLQKIAPPLSIDDHRNYSYFLQVRIFFLCLVPSLMSLSVYLVIAAFLHHFSYCLNYALETRGRSFVRQFWTVCICILKKFYQSDHLDTAFFWWCLTLLIKSLSNQKVQITKLPFISDFRASFLHFLIWQPFY